MRSPNTPGPCLRVSRTWLPGVIWWPPGRVAPPDVASGRHLVAGRACRSAGRDFPAASGQEPAGARGYDGRQPQNRLAGPDRSVRSLTMIPSSLSRPRARGPVVSPCRHDGAPCVLSWPDWTPSSHGRRSTTLRLIPRCRGGLGVGRTDDSVRSVLARSAAPSTSPGQRDDLLLAGDAVFVAVELLVRVVERRTGLGTR
jgi:hypothetical protein